MYSVKDLYPNLGGTDTREQTIPERSEQASLSGAEITAPVANGSGQAGNVWMGLVLLLAVLIFFNMV